MKKLYIITTTLFAAVPPINPGAQQTGGTFASMVPSPASGDIGQHYAFGDILTLGEGLGRLVMPVFSIAAALVLIYFLIGAFKYLTSGGDKEALEGAQQMIIHAIIGFVLLMFIFLILQFLPQIFGFSSSVII